MKKMVFSTLVALGCAMATFSANGTQFKVYDVKMSLRTTKASGVASTSCGDKYVYRVKAAHRIEGVIAGCGCLAATGDPSCNNFVTYFWDATTKTAITNYTYNTELVQRIGKKGEQVEHVVTFTVNGQDGELYNLMLSGFGNYKSSKKGPNYDTMSVSGNVTGMKDAPYKVIPGSCCSAPDSIEQSKALEICEDGSCAESNISDTTPVCGTYSMKYNSSKSKRCEKSGVNAKTLGVPAYAR